MNTLSTLDGDLIEGTARVVGVDNHQVWLSAEQPSACSSCGTRSACSSGAVKPSGSWRAPRSLGTGLAPLVLGDTVRIGVNRSALTRATLTAYALPLVTLLIAAVLMQDASDAMAGLVSLAGLLLGVAAARVLARRWRHALVPVVLGRTQTNTVSSCAPPAAVGAFRGIAITETHQRSL